MDDEQDLVGRLFAIITGRMEDAAALAAEGQNPSLDPSARISLVNEIVSSAEEVVGIALTAAKLCESGNAT
jgi:hypothetical protein